MKPYHPANLKHLPYAGWRVVLLAWVAKLLSVQIHIHGIPFGASRRQADSSGDRPIRVDRAGNAILPERKVVLKATEA